MNSSSATQQELLTDGFTVINNIFTEQETETILQIINRDQASSPTGDIFAIRRFLLEIPALQPYIFTEKLRSVIGHLFGSDYFVVKSIYFDKPERSNWFVAYHQDLTISVQQKVDLDGFGPWTVKPGQFSVRPPLHILENIYTVRIHLDATDEHNGALKVLPGSHLQGLIRPEHINSAGETFCRVPKGGIMIMRPLLLHASHRSTHGIRRRVIHIEFSNSTLPAPLQWAEFIPVG